MARARRIRVLIYEGPEEWVIQCTENPNNFVQGKRILDMKTPDHATPFEVRPATEIPVPNKMITEHLAEMEIL